MTLFLIKSVLEVSEWRQAGRQAAVSRRGVPVRPFVFSMTPGNVRSALVAEGPNRPIVQKTEVNMTIWALMRNPTLKLTTPTWRLAICALSRRVLLNRDYQKRKTLPQRERSSLQ